MDDIRIRAAKPEDAEELLKIYAPYVEHTAVSFEYVPPQVAEFRARISATLMKYPYLVAERGGELLGYAYAGAFKARAAYDWAVETSIYIKRDLKRQGLGRRLYETLESLLREQGILNVNACIAYPEPEDEYLTYDSVAFHRRMGYSLVGEFHRCANKFGRWYGMVWMEKSLGEHGENPQNVRWWPEVEAQFKDCLQIE